jgi:putative toxin-antitoxin system antitoxin component (TIGR02293 family)
MPSRSHSKPHALAGDPDPSAVLPEATAEEGRELMDVLLRSLSARDWEVLTRLYLREQPREQIYAEMGITEAQLRLIKARAMARFAALNRRTSARGRRPGNVLAKGPGTDARVVQLERAIPIVAHAVAVFGDEQKASHWLQTPLPLLGNRSPVEVLSSGDIQAVDTILTRIEHNIPS